MLKEYAIEGAANLFGPVRRIAVHHHDFIHYVHQRIQATFDIFLLVVGDNYS